MAKTYKVIDLFAGPGGLAEGFASLTVGQRRPFEVALSVEKEASAHCTLRLRAFVRQFGADLPPEYLACLSGAPQPDWGQLYPRQWAAAEAHAVQLELGTRQASSILEPHLKALEDQPTVVIGGPPCQAYSVAGRVRNKGVENYSARDDHRHFLYREYIRILRQVRPVGFVMENVKGLLSSKVDGVRILDMVLNDLKNAAGPGSYELVALTPGFNVRAKPGKPAAAEDFLVRAEAHGVPQARHRVIIVGIRRDCAGRLQHLGAGSLMPAAEDQVTVSQALDGIPEIRSGLSRGDSFQAWRDTLVDVMDDVLRSLAASGSSLHAKLIEPATLVRNSFWMRCPVLPRSATQAASVGGTTPRALLRWLEGRADGRLANHESRGHMPTDLSRYFFAAMFAEVHGRSPKSAEFPEALAPSHRNWSSGDFKDRFRVQQSDRPSSTVTSHIAKDGHYFIHPAPMQCRALTVREAARLQTFPDDYLFLGNRTEQYVQVGNAVPPFLACQIAQALLRIIEEPVECSTADDSTVPLAEALGG